MRVTLFRDHPAEGWPSMDRYAQAVYEALTRIAPAAWCVQMPMPPPPKWNGTRLQILNRLTRYAAWAYTQQGSVNHILDQSYAHMLYRLDPHRTVVTVHDIAPLRFPARGRGLSRLAWAIAWRALQRAQHLIVDSTFTATELAACLRPGDRRLYVVPPAVSGSFQPVPSTTVAALRSQYASLGRYMLLHVGHLQSRKNLVTAIRALGLLRARGWDAFLLQAGGIPNDLLLREIRLYGLQERVLFLGRVSDEQLITLYSAADVFVFPSLYEGFGLPVLEAMACGTPVVASSAASLPEVVGKAGLLVDPNNAETWASAIASVLSEPDVSQSLRVTGRSRVEEFSWHRVATRLLQVYASVGYASDALEGTTV